MRGSRLTAILPSTRNVGLKVWTPPTAKTCTSTSPVPAPPPLIMPTPPAGPRLKRSVTSAFIALYFVQSVLLSERFQLIFASTLSRLKLTGAESK